MKMNCYMIILSIQAYYFFCGTVCIGMYQHDIEERVLDSRLDEVVEQCVSEVGVDVNCAR